MASARPEAGERRRLAEPGERLAAAAIVATPLLLCLHASRELAVLDAPGAALALAGGLLGLLTMDGVTGLVHWACDTWGDERTPWLGPGLIRSFREHHRDPRAMLAHDWTEVNREPALAVSAALLLLTLPPLQQLLEGRSLAWGFLLAFLAYGAGANQLHLWSHMERPPRWARALQCCGLALSPARHAVHHRAACTEAYCISTGWLNGPLDALGFWRALERAIAAVTGARPRSSTR